MGKIKNLLIVESPAKAKTIKKYLGKDFEVRASFGHLVDLPKNKFGVDIENDFKPQYEVPSDKKKYLNELKKVAKDAEKIWIGTDEDREGEAIGWHLINQLKLDLEKTPRITFHEITKKALQEAIKNPRKIDINLVNAQQARRILDRIVGYEISPVLWKKIKRGLSAGRVQSVALRLVVEKEREIMEFGDKSEFKVFGEFKTENKEKFEAELNKRFSDKEKVIDFIKKIEGKDFQVDKIDTKLSKRSAPAPFITSTLQQEAARKFGFSVSRTMKLAQNLYEAGHITYMRTDSVNIAEDAVSKIKKIVTEKFGAEYFKKTVYKNKVKGAQEAHECIRPTHLEVTEVGANEAERKLYRLIRSRTIASQMKPAEFDKTVVEIKIPGKKEKFVAKGEILRFPGWLKVYGEVDNKDKLLPEIKEGDKLNLVKLAAEQKHISPPARYDEASLVKKLEELGIGRPSTYATIVTTIQQRGYVEKKSIPGEKKEFVRLIYKNGEIKEEKFTKTVGVQKNKLFPTDIGMIVNDFLLENFPNIMDYSFTANVEEDLDKIAEGKEDYVKVLKNFYGDFHPVVEKVADLSEFVTKEKILGKDPKTGKNIIVRMARYGPVIQLGDRDDPDKKYFSFPSDKNIENITLEDALEMMKLPKKVGIYKNKEIFVNTGRYGPYLSWNGKNISLKGVDNWLTISESDAINFIENSLKSNQPLKVFTIEGKKAEIFVGRYGPYIKYDGKNYKIRGVKDLQNISEQKVREILKIGK